MSKKRYWRAIQRKRDSYEDRFTKRMHDALADSIAPILADLRAFGPATALSDLSVDTAPLIEAYKELYGTVGTEFARQTYRALNEKKDEGAVQDQWLEDLQAFAANEAGERIAGVNAYTERKIREVLTEAVNEGWGVEKTARAMQRSAGVSRVRARRIVRTEIVSASNRGSLTGAKSTRLNLRKEWIDTQDGRTRESHVVAGDQAPVDIDAPLRVAGYAADYPGDLSLPAAEVVNCRCTVAYQKYDE